MIKNILNSEKFQRYKKIYKSFSEQEILENFISDNYYCDCLNENIKCYFCLLLEELKEMREKQ